MLNSAKILLDGYCVVRNGVPESIRVPLRELCAEQCPIEKRTEILQPFSFDAVRPLQREFTVHVHSLLRHFPDVRYLSSAVLPKYPGDPHGKWHTDWWDWHSIDTAYSVPSQIGAICYLDDANSETGHLKVIPQSHRKAFPGVWENGDLTDPIEQVSIRASAGDIVFIDARLLHAVTENVSDTVRFACTLWFLVDFANLPAQVKSSAMLCCSRELQAAFPGMYPDFWEKIPAPRAHNTKPNYEI